MGLMRDQILESSIDRLIILNSLLINEMLDSKQFFEIDFA
jgi:hypothetical protein